VIDNLYNQIIDAGTHVAESIKVAEAAKVIENTQRDLNIALINELAMIFDRLNIDTNSVLEAAGSKWNFLNFKPGLVGGHCIGVDPYYLTHKSEQAGYHPEVILAGRKVNDNMHNFISTKLINHLQKQNKKFNECKVLVMGITFKENCPDIRNTKVIPLIERLTKNNLNVEVYDPWISPSISKILSNIKFINSPEAGQYDAIIFAVAHKEFINMPSDKLIKMKKKDGVIFDLKHIISRDLADLRL
jgi:UDP-N-acetyl-D-galactosamine dehydrogenase